MQTITFSKQFLNLLDIVLKVTKAKRALFFRQGERCYLTISNRAMVLNISAGPSDLNFNGDSVNIYSLVDFVQYAKAIEYPEKDGTSITVVTEMSMAGHSYEYIKFASNSKVLRSITADPSLFTEVDHKVPAPRNSDILSRLCNIRLDEVMLDRITSDIKLAPGCDFVSISVDDASVIMAMKGKLAQQIDIKIDPTHTMIDDEDAIKAAYGRGQIRMFMADYFYCLNGIVGKSVDDAPRGKKVPVDEASIIRFDTELRFHAPSNVAVLKSFASIRGNNVADPIILYAGLTESEAESISNFDMITDTFAGGK